MRGWGETYGDVGCGYVFSKLWLGELCGKRVIPRIVKNGMKPGVRRARGRGRSGSGSMSMYV